MRIFYRKFLRSIKKKPKRRQHVHKRILSNQVMPKNLCRHCMEANKNPLGQSKLGGFDLLITQAAVEQFNLLRLQ